VLLVQHVYYHIDRFFVSTTKLTATASLPRWSTVVTQYVISRRHRRLNDAVVSTLLLELGDFDSNSHESFRFVDLNDIRTYAEK